MIRNIIFDWSGTLVDDLPAVWQATNYVLAQARQPEMSLEQFRAEFCLPFTIFYDRHVPHIPMAQLEEWFHCQFRQVQASVRALPHAREFLEFCRARQFRTFLLSTVHHYFDINRASTGLGLFSTNPIQCLGKASEKHEILTKNQLAAKKHSSWGHAARHRDGAAWRHSFLPCLRATAPLNRVGGARLIVEHLIELREATERNGSASKPPRSFGRPPAGRHRGRVDL